ncbi:uncharacterized protein EV420DRAFT_1723969 [Desarmillaria tabescens]|uniref:Uncharacterized protein n=1 Tax=Armillaria tabescens TaxID=1929756 RepID=A0AA39MRK1_ARMTA|nr:uncharacterized protein EV420DRAFT_1723969 [Desarmillaria tabescens]KAK0443419.1 hypothetical protein EV420DRAFT_1723969 [Desarmillaria tabescens]
MDSNTTPGSVSTIHLPTLQSSPPTQHLPSHSLGFPDPPALLMFPVDPADISDTNSQNVTCLWPTCVPLFTFTEHSHLQERKDRVIQILRLSRDRKLGYGLRSARVLTRNQYTNTFSEETRILDHLLTSVFACTTFTKDVVYKMDQNIYQELHTRLTTRRAIASSSLNSFGYSDFKVPTWGINTVKGLTANDFEVYALQYCIRIEHFLHMLNYVHDWNNLRTRIYLDEKLLAAQRNPDRARVMIMEHYLHAVPPVSHSNPFKSKTSFQTSYSDLSWEGVHYTATRDEEQHPSNSRATKTQISHRVQFPEDLDFRDPSMHKSIYQGCALSNLNSSRGGKNGNRLPSRRGPCNSQIPAYPSHSEYTSIGFDTTFQAMDVPACKSNPSTRDSCENKFINTPALSHNIGNQILPYSTNNKIRPFRIASNTPCTRFLEKNKNSRSPRKVRRHIDWLQRRLLRIIHATRQVTSTNDDRQRIRMRMRECIQPLPRLPILGSEATKVHRGTNTIDLDVLQKTLDSGSYTMPVSRTEIRMLSTHPRVCIKQKMKFCLARHKIDSEVKKDTAPSTINRECQLYCRKGCNCRHPKHRRVPGDIRAKICIVIPAKPKPTAGHNNQFLDVSLTSSTNTPMIPTMLEATANE